MPREIDYDHQGQLIDPCYTKKPIHKADFKITSIYGNIIVRFDLNFEEIEAGLILIAACLR